MQDIPRRLGAAQRGAPELEESRPASFCTTSWQFLLWELDFEDEELNDENIGRPVLFKGSQFHPKGLIEDTYSGVVVPGWAQGWEYQMELPTARKNDAYDLHNQLCNQFGFDQSL